MHKIENMNTENIQILVDQSKAREFCMIHNNIFDQLQKTLRPTEFSVLMIAIRKIHGFDKKSDKISISQFMEYTGLSNKTVCNSIRVLIERGLLLKLSTDYKKGNEYALVSYVKKSQPKPNNDIQLCKKVTAPVSNLHTQETHIKTHQSKALTRDIETKVSNSVNYLDDIQIIKDLARSKFRDTELFLIKYLRAIKRTSQDEVSGAILGYCQSKWHKDNNAWKFDKLLRSDEMILEYAEKATGIKKDLKFPSIEQIKNNPVKASKYIRDNFNYEQIKEKYPDAFRAWAETKLYSDAFADLLLSEVSNA